jgi:hypothetical protein
MPKYLRALSIITICFAIPFFLMIYACRCQRLRISEYNRMIERIKKEQQVVRLLEELNECCEE